MWCWPLRCFFGTFTSGTWAWPLADSAEILRSWGNAAMPHISMLMRKNLLVNISKLVRDMRNIFAVRRPTRKPLRYISKEMNMTVLRTLSNGVQQCSLSACWRDFFPEYKQSTYLWETWQIFLLYKFSAGGWPKQYFLLDVYNLVQKIR